LAEIVKAGIIADYGLFERVERTPFAQLRHDYDLVGEIILSAIRVKAEIVGRDERESGERRKLNLGHTMAHAIEKCSSKLNHGEAVAVGLYLIAKAAIKRGVIALQECERIEQLLLRAGFTLEPPCELRELLKAVKKDKKSEGDKIHIVFPTTIGNCIVEPMPLEEFKAMIKS
jgi:3-dehydroquinate synthase